MLFSVIVNSVYAYDFKADGIYYNILSAADKTCEVVKGEVEYSGSVSIPQSVVYNSRALSVININKNAFSKNDNLESVIIPSSVISITHGAFYQCSNLSSVTISSGVTNIEESAFSHCSALTSISIPGSVQNIGDYAFRHCSSLVSVVISSGVTNIGENAFESCTALKSITIPGSITSIGAFAFNGCTSISTATLQYGIKSIGAYAFSYCYSLRTVTVPNSVTNIGGSAFYSCKSLSSFTIPDSVTSIKSGTFYDCSSLKFLTIPNNITKIGEQAFYNCSGLETLTIPSSVKDIETLHSRGETYEAFDGCHPKVCIFGCSGGNANKVPQDCIRKITLMADVVDFTGYWGYYFKSADKLDTLCSIATNPPIIDNVSENQKASLKVFVPKGTLAAYQAADVWKEFWNMQESDEITGVSSPVMPTTDVKEVGRYSITGVKIEQKRPGINIIKMSDGTSRKVLVK